MMASRCARLASNIRLRYMVSSVPSWSRERHIASRTAHQICNTKLLCQKSLSRRRNCIAVGFYTPRSHRR
ncbi:hypothetical protein M3J09_008612 [Ascochyta lentis]